MGKDDIVLSKEHGLNPTMILCPYCREVKCLALTGAKGDKMARQMGISSGEMPSQIIIKGDCEPCDKCKEKWFKPGMVVLIEADKDESGVSMTGRFSVVNEEAVKELLSELPDKLAQTLDSHALCMDRKAYHTLIGQFSEHDKDFADATPAEPEV